MIATQYPRTNNLVKKKISSKSNDKFVETHHFVFNSFKLRNETLHKARNELRTAIRELE